MYILAYKGGTEMSNDTNSGGIGFVGLLAIVFITLKLTGYITWSWIWVLSPLWISLGIGLSVLVIMLILAAFIYRKTGK